MSYTTSEKAAYCKAIVAQMEAYEGHNQYSQTNRWNLQTSGTSGSGDCSSTVNSAIKAVMGIDIGTNTTAQYVDSDLMTADVTITKGIPDESAMQLGDLLYFRGTDSSRAAYGYVGHVEMYVGDNQTSGHGSGVGPTRKTMTTYCTTRYNTSSPNVSPANKGLICVRRLKVLDGAGSGATTTYTVINTGCFPQYTGSSSSIVTALSAVGCSDTSLSYRKTIASLNGIDGYTGTSSQNTSMLTLLKAGTLKDPSSTSSSSTTTTTETGYFPAYTGSSNSIITALAAVGCTDTSLSYRKTIATLNGISSYTGTATQNTTMLKYLKAGTLKDPATYSSGVTYFPQYTGTSSSIVTALKAVGATSSLTYRKQIASVNGISNYSGTASQNTQMLNLLKAGTLIKP